MGSERLRVVSLESRRGGDMASLLRRHGMVPIVAPSMQEVALEDQADALAFGETLLSGEFDVLVLLTGVGFQMLVDAIATQHPRERVIAAIGAVKRACRGPKPVLSGKSADAKAAESQVVSNGPTGTADPGTLRR